MRAGTSNFREKSKVFHVQEETWKDDCKREKLAEVLAHEPPRTYAEQAAAAGPTVSASHAAHTGADARAVNADRPAGKASPVGATW
mmetsp:Transcript_9526/g.28407  ORF Transcript_9526/g.28407 Transcript_9526/m.28407 type:complete len:86 (+) Transcript_9526:89-346(+)